MSEATAQEPTRFPWKNTNSRESVLLIELETVQFIPQKYCLSVEFTAADSGKEVDSFLLFVLQEGKMYSVDITPYAKVYGKRKTSQPLRFMKDVDGNALIGGNEIDGYGVSLSSENQKLDVEISDLHFFDCQVQALDLLQYDEGKLPDLYPDLCTPYSPQVEPKRIDGNRYIDFISSIDLTESDETHVLFVDIGTVYIIPGTWDGRYGDHNRFSVDWQVRSFPNWENSDQWIEKHTCTN